MSANSRDWRIADWYKDDPLLDRKENYHREAMTHSIDDAMAYNLDTMDMPEAEPPQWLRPPVGEGPSEVITFMSLNHYAHIEDLILEELVCLG